MSALKKQSDSKRTPAVALRAERELHQIAARVLRLAKERGVPETEVHPKDMLDWNVTPPSDSP